MENVKVTLVKSTVGCKANQIATAKSLGLTKPGKSIVGKNDGLAGLCKTESLSSSDLVSLAANSALYESNLNVCHYCYLLMPLHLRD